MFSTSLSSENEALPTPACRMPAFSTRNSTEPPLAPLPLLPAFPGVRTHARALEEGVRVHGCTVHFVTPQLDHGPIIIQAAVPVLEDDTEDSLAARVLAQEHRIFPQAVRWLCESRVTVDAEGRATVRNAMIGEGPLVSPAVEA